MDKDVREGIIALQDIIKNETNIKEIDFVDDSSEMPVVKKAKCNFRVMGKKYGKQMKAVAALVEAVGTEEINAFEKTGELHLELDGQPITVVSEYMEKFAVSRLVGAPPGYVGYDEGFLIPSIFINNALGKYEELIDEGEMVIAYIMDEFLDQWKSSSSMFR